MSLFTRSELAAATALVHRHMNPTPHYAWPQLAALMQEHARMQGRRVGVILCGGNIDTDRFAQILCGKVPLP
ncbi:threonine dehydratase [Rhodobacteraceae bacterium MBR-64]|jgi:threonine dehydratase